VQRFSVHKSPPLAFIVSRFLHVAYMPDQKPSESTAENASDSESELA
jgi:hypothetical protein